MKSNTQREGRWTRNGDFSSSVTRAKATPAVFDLKNNFMLSADYAFSKVKEIKLYTYSDLSFALAGDTKEIKDWLPHLGGHYNPRLRFGKGWVFSDKRLNEVETFLSAYLLRKGWIWYGKKSKSKVKH